VDRHSPFVGIGEHAGVVIGRRTLKPREVPKTATSGELNLNGRVVARGLRPPFITTIDFGRVPKRQVVQFTSLDPRGRVLTRATTVVNERRDAFDVRIVEPAETWTSGRVRVTATATVPGGRQIDEVAIEWRGSTAARLVTPPYTTEIEVAPQEEGLLRVVLRLDDGSEVEDARILNAGAMTMSSEVHLVEIPVHVEGPVPAAADIVLREDGKRRAVERVVTAKDAPLRIALLLDTSLSMTDHLLDLQESAARFVERNLVPSDRATLIAFGGSESVLWPTSDRQKIIRTILSLQPRGGTALYSAIVSAFFNLQSAGCRRAVVLFTDGADTGSTFSVAEVEEVARRMAVPLYVLAFTQSPSGFTPHRGVRGAASYESSTFQRSEGRRALQRIARDSGGKLFELQSLRDVDAIWNAIAKELRQQSLVVFRASESGGSWRALDVRSPRTVMRAPQGIYVSAAEPRGN
ncbi:MAG: VWA domain-containing protein, partial [Thermoanaerobaculia bacterium]